VPLEFQLANNSNTRITSKIDNQDYSPEIPEIRKKYDPENHQKHNMQSYRTEGAKTFTAITEGCL
jgi:hypothetical protein